jgi:hypothetical protein
MALAFSVIHALPMLGLRLSAMAQAMQHGLWFGLGLGAALLGVDFAWAPTGWPRIFVAGALGGPLLGFLLLRLLRQRRLSPPPVEANPAALDDRV